MRAGIPEPQEKTDVSRTIKDLVESISYYGYLNYHEARAEFHSTSLRDRLRIAAKLLLDTITMKLRQLIK